jgi:hypothetical protein
MMEMNEATLEVGSRTFKINFIRLENALVAFLFEDRKRLGTVAVAMPGKGEVAVGRSSVLVGGKYLMTSRALAEKLAAKSGRMTLLSLFTELDEAEALRTYSKLLDKLDIVKEEENTKPSRLSPSIGQNV